MTRGRFAQSTESVIGLLVGVIAGLAAQRYSDTEIGDGLGLTRWRVQDLRRQYGIAGNAPGRRPRSAVPGGAR